MMRSSSGKRSATPTLSSVIAAAVFFGAGVVVSITCFQKAREDGDILFEAIGGAGVVVCGFMTVVSLMAIRNVLKRGRQATPAHRHVRLPICR